MPGSMGRARVPTLAPLARTCTSQQTLATSSAWRPDRVLLGVWTSITAAAERFTCCSGECASAVSAPHNITLIALTIDTATALAPSAKHAPFPVPLSHPPPSLAPLPVAAPLWSPPGPRRAECRWSPEGGSSNLHALLHIGAIPFTPYWSPKGSSGRGKVPCRRRRGQAVRFRMSIGASIGACRRWRGQTKG